MAISPLEPPTATTQTQTETVEYQLRYLDPGNQHIITQSPTAETRRTVAPADIMFPQYTDDEMSAPPPRQRQQGQPPPHDPSALARRAIHSDSRFYPSQHFIISCGTVTVDIAAAKVLLVYNRPNGIYQLPKGRKEIGEDGLLATALRETLEETGYVATPLQLRIPTRSSQPLNAITSAEPKRGTLIIDGAEVPAKGLTVSMVNSEPAGCIHWDDMDAQARKFVFFFAAEGDSSALPMSRPVEDMVKHEAWWFGYGEAMGRLCFDAERKAVIKVLGELRRCGYHLQLDPEVSE